MKRLHFSSNGMMFLPFNEGPGWQFHFRPRRARFRASWTSYGIDRRGRPPSDPGWSKPGSDGNNVYVLRRLFIFHWLWFHIWMDLGIISVRRY